MGTAALVALDHVSMKSRKAELVAIMGTVRFRQSTLMNILGCLSHPHFRGILPGWRGCQQPGQSHPGRHPQHQDRLHLPVVQPAGPHHRFAHVMLPLVYDAATSTRVKNGSNWGQKYAEMSGGRPHRPPSRRNSRRAAAARGDCAAP